MSAQTTDFFISHYLTCSQGSYGLFSAVKTTMPNKPSQIKRTAESLKWVPWLWKKEGPLKSYQKASRKWTGCIHTHKYVFLPFYLLDRTAFQPGFFQFVLLKLEAVTWLRDPVLEKVIQLKTVMQVQAPNIQGICLSPTDLSGTLTQELTHQTAPNVIPLKISRA